MVTEAGTGKARRLRVINRVRFAACNASGRRLFSEWPDGTGRIVEDPALHDQALAALQQKYGWQPSLAILMSRLRGRYRERIVLELAPAPAG